MKKLLFLLIVMLIALVGCESMLTDNRVDQLDFYNEQDKNLNEHRESGNEQDKNLNEHKEIVKIHSDYPHYNNLRHLSETADDIVMGTIVDSRVDELFIMYDLDGRLLDEGLIYTIYTLHILDVYKGMHEIGDYIEIKQPGGENDRGVIYVADQPALNIRENYVFFLASYDNIVPACYLNPTQSIYHFDITNRDSSLKLTNVYERSDIEITYGQLHAIDER